MSPALSLHPQTRAAYHPWKRLPATTALWLLRDIPQSSVPLHPKSVDWNCPRLSRTPSDSRVADGFSAHATELAISPRPGALSLHPPTRPRGPHADSAANPQ